MFLSRKGKPFSLMMLYLFTVVCGCFIFSRVSEAAEGISEIRKGIVKVSVIAQVPDYSVPWNPGRMEQRAGSGFILSGNRLLTNAHIVSDARFIAVEKEGNPRKFEAGVRFIAHDCDLAVLKVEDESFFDGTVPLKIGGIPALNSIVNVVGYPIGGKRLSVTRGVVSRIDYQLYTHSMMDQHLAIQIDAAVNPGNSGGPVLQNGAVVGVAFQVYRGEAAQGVGYMIPVPVIKRFLRDISDGRYDRYVDLGIRYFPLINRAMRRAVGLGPGEFGVMITQVFRGGPCGNMLREGDILLSIDGFPVSSDGYVAMDGERVHMAEVVERKLKGDKVRLKILRGKEPKEVTVSLYAPWPFQMQALRYDVRPRFVLFGGLLFQPLSRPFLERAKTRNVDLIYRFSSYLDRELYLETPEIVVLSRILPDPINVYLQPFVNSIVRSVNGHRIRTLEDVAEAFKKPSECYVIRLEGNGRPLVLEGKAVKVARERILRRYGVLRESYLGDSFVPEEWKEKRAGLK
ncbi:MAG: trypsin-like peptidase domain-containing protein [Deltaproteobacteria bacterium]|nr:trypsin-like peptidase domain-containing protein [Deltaproteobacteria bacterium]MBW2303938.1 trypsin-like peptidase domain-containing protein [Deltaproteobacteria bacterium]